jgi:hypothetical protein
VAEQPDAPGAEKTSTQEWDEAGDKAEARCVTRVCSLESLVEAMEVDLNTWGVERWVGNKWEGFYVDKESGAPATQDLWQIKATFARKKGWDVEEFRALLLADIKGYAAAPVPKLKRKKSEYNEVLAWLSIYDHHFGKLAWEEEVGNSYDVKIATTRFNNAADDLLNRSRMWKPERIGIVAGQDAIHVDQGRKAETGHGTPQDCDGRWQKAFQAAKDCYLKTIDKALEIAPVTVVCRPGNHDAEKMYCLGEVIKGYYHNNPNVEVINRPALWDSFRWGLVLLYVGHFELMAEKRKGQLPVDMANNCGLDFAETKWHEIHCGHVHHEKETVWVYRTSETILSTILRFLPSLSGTDLWHEQKGYVAPLAAECHLYDRKKGRIGYLTHAVSAEEEQ